jgi:uncharacterized protein YndB with AHSA1/START domain
MATITTKPSLTIKRRFNAPPAKAFAAWTDPEKLKHWMPRLLPRRTSVSGAASAS